MKLSPVLKQLIEAFSSQMLHCSTPNGAFDRCKPTACRFYEAAENIGLHPELIRLTYYKRPIARAHKKWQKLGGIAAHYVTCVDNTCVDWTTRQLDSRSPFPLILSRKNLYSRWERNTVVPYDIICCGTWGREADND